MDDSYLQENAEGVLLQLMHLFYNIGIYLYGIAIRIASLFNAKAKLWVQGRKNWSHQLPDTNNRPVIWFHCASLGEFDQGLPLMEKIKKSQPESFLLVTFFSPSGMQFHQKRKHSADHVMYLPLDTPRNARKFIDHFKPEKAFFVKYEFWLNLIQYAHKYNCKIYNVSGIFRPSHRFFKWYGSHFRKALHTFSGFFVQNKESKSLLNGIGINQVTITGDSRFDRVLENKKQASRNEIIENFKGDHPLLVIGSSWPADEELLAPWINQYEGKVLIAPHNVDEGHIKGIMQLIKGVRYTQVKGDISENNVLILDTIGQLANAYSYGDYAYVGGGFSGNLHNILEPAVFGLPVLFGPKHKRFPEAQSFINQGFGFSVSNTQEFIQSFQKVTDNLATIKKAEILFVESNAGASQRIFEATMLP